MNTTSEVWAAFSAFIAVGEEYINGHDAEIQAEIRQRAARWHAPNPPSKEGILGHYRALMLHDTSRRASRIGCPTWIAVGTSDTVTPPSYSKRLNALVRGSVMVVFQGGPHRLLNFSVSEFNKAALTFLLQHH